MLQAISYEKGGGKYKKPEKFTPSFVHMTTNRLYTQQKPVSIILVVKENFVTLEC